MAPFVVSISKYFVLTTMWQGDNIFTLHELIEVL